MVVFNYYRHTEAQVECKRLVMRGSRVQRVTSQTLESLNLEECQSRELYLHTPLL